MTSPYLLQSVRGLGQAIKDRRIRGAYQSAYMGDPQAMQQLAGQSPELARQLQMDIQKRKDTAAQQGLSKQANQSKRRGAFKDEVRVIMGDLSKFGSYAEAKAYGQNAKTRLIQNYPEISKRQGFTPEFTEQDFNEAKTIHGKAPEEGGSPFDFGSGMEGKSYQYYAEEIQRKHPDMSPDDITAKLAQHHLEKQKFVNTPQGMMMIPGEDLPTFKNIDEVVQDKVNSATKADEARPVITRPISETSKKVMAGNMALYDAINPLVENFKDGYVGSFTETGQDIELAYAKRFGDKQATEKADWWQAYDSMVTNVRNAAFGASLTPGEQAAFDKLIVKSTFSPELAKKNITRQLKIISDAISREKNSLQAEKYNPDSIAAITKGFEEKKAPAAPQADDANLSVTVDGKTYKFPDAESLNAYKKAVGL